LVRSWNIISIRGGSCLSDKIMKKQKILRLGPQRRRIQMGRGVKKYIIFLLKEGEGKT